jgi:hypothetical protein
VASKISVIIDVAVDKANSSLQGFKKSIQDADGAAGKFKAGAGAAMDSVKANAGNLAMAGGAALVTFGVKAVGAFQETALAAGEMRDALGLTAEEASQYIEVADDLGIGSEKLEKAIGRMNVTAGKTPEAFAAIGAELVKNADGTTNVNKTFQSTVDALNRIPDATDRAAAASRIFGRGWQDMAELIEMGGQGIQEALDAVEGGKVIDDKEVERARKFRDTLDTLKGTVEELTVEVGGSLVPVLTDLGDAIISIKGAADSLPDFGSEDSFGGSIYNAARNAVDPVHALQDGIETLGEVFGNNTDEVTASETAWGDFFDQIDAVSSATDDATSSTDAGTTAYAANRQELEQSIYLHEREEDAIKRVNDARRLGTDNIYAARDAERSWWTQLQTTQGVLDDVEAGELERSAALDDVALSTADVTAKQLEAQGVDITTTEGKKRWVEELKNVAAELNGPMRDAVLEYIALVSGIPAERTTYIGVWGPGAGNAPRISKGGGGLIMHDGGIVPGRPGEEVPALLEAGERVIPADQANRTMGTGGGVTIINVDATNRDALNIANEIERKRRLHR